MSWPGHQDGACDHEGQCVLLAIWTHAGDIMADFLSNYTLDDIAKTANGLLPWPGSG